MKIQKIEAFVLKDKLTKSFFFSQWEYNERVICIVKLTASDGQYGWGEGYGPANVLEAGIKFLEPIVIGQDPLENEVIWHSMYRKTLDFARRGILVAAMSAIDIAIWDLKGKILGQPVSVLLGGAHRDKINLMPLNFLLASRVEDPVARIFLSEYSSVPILRIRLGSSNL